VRGPLFALPAFARRARSPRAPARGLQSRAHGAGARAYASSTRTRIREYARTCCSIYAHMAWERSPLIPKGSEDNSPAIHRRGRARGGCGRSPEGTTEGCSQPSPRDSGIGWAASWAIPSVETLGYCQPSPRDSGIGWAASWAIPSVETLGYCQPSPRDCHAGPSGL